MSKKHSVTVITHKDGSNVIVWYESDALSTMRSCLRRKEVIEVHTEEMTEKQFDALPDYEGDC